MATTAVADRAVSLNGFTRRSTRAECLKIAMREFIRLGLDKDNLDPCLWELYNELWSPLDEWAIAQMHQYWNYNFEALLRRGRGSSSDAPAKPRINVAIELTTKGNLRAEWFPRGWSSRGADFNGAFGCDFKEWLPREYRSGSFGSRPSNELFFIRGVDSAVRSIHPYSDEPSITCDLNPLLLRACAAAVEDLKARLDPHFDVCMLTDIFIEWQDGEKDAASSRRCPPPTIIGWTISDPDQKLKEIERDEIANLEKFHGFSAEKLLRAWREELKQHLTGPASSPDTLAGRIARRLEVQGFRTKPEQIERLVDLLREHQAGHCPARDQYGI